MILRDYQHKMVNDTREALRHHRSVVIQSECGSGKGTVAAYMINRAVEKGKRVLFLVRGKDRVADMDKRVTNLNIPHGVLVSERKRERWHSVQVASSDTVYRMEHKPAADIIVIDECHRMGGKSFRDVLAFYPATKIIGMSATPELGNGRSLGVKSGGIFEAMVSGPTVTELIAQKHLVGSRMFAPTAPADLGTLKKKRNGEFDENQGAAICDNAKVIGDVVKHWERFSDHKAAIFGFNKKHAFDIAESFRMKGHNWAYVDADTPDGDIHTPGTRKFFWHQMEFGDLVGVAAIDVISLGWDMPTCKYIGLASKIASFPVFRQRLGRGSRPYRNYERFIVSDHCNGFSEFLERGPFFESEIDWQLDGEPIKLKDSESATRVGTCKRPIRVPESGVPIWFLGPLSKDSAWMLPCFATFPAGPAQCPYCKLPLEVQARPVTVEDGELQEVQVVAKSEKMLAYEAKMKARYFELVKEIRTKRKKNGFPFSEHYPAMQLKLEHHRYPKREWKEEALRLYGPPLQVEEPQGMLI